MRSIAAGRLGPSENVSRDEEVFVRDESVARSDDNADDAVLVSPKYFLPVSRLPSPPIYSRGGTIWEPSTPFFLSPRSLSEVPESSMIAGSFLNRTLFWSNPNVARFSCLPVAVEGRLSTF